MRILCLTPWFPASPGAQSGNFVLDSVTALVAAGHTVKVAVTTPWRPHWTRVLHEDFGPELLQVQSHDPALAIEQIVHLSIPRNYCRRFARWLFKSRVLPAVLQIVERFQPDVILAHTEQAGFVATCATQLCHVPTVVVMHGINTSPRLNTAGERARLRNTLDAADRVVLVGEPLRQHFAGIAGRSDHFRIVHNGFLPPAPQQMKAAAPWPSRLRFISVSNLHEGKGIDLTLRALAELQRQGHRNWQYTIVGSGGERAMLQALVAENGLAEQVHFTGAVDHSRVYGLLAQADVFVLPSWREAFGIAWLEAMACGLLAIAVRGQGPATFIEEGETGLLVAARSVDDLVRCLRQVFDDPAAMQAIAVRGQVRVQQEFSWQAHAQKLALVCAEAAGASR